MATEKVAFGGPHEWPNGATNQALAVRLRQKRREFILWAIGLWAIGSLLTSAGCTATHPGDELSQGVPPGPLPTGAGGTGSSSPGWVPIDCDGLAPRLWPNVKLARAVDYAAIFREYPTGVGGVATAAGAGVMSETGKVCRTAKNLAACDSAQLAAGRASDRCVQQGVCGAFLLTTLGDQVTRSDDRSALLTLLGPIDSPSKAGLVAQYDGYQLSCATGARSSGNGYDLRMEHRTCGGLDSSYAETIHVTADGSTEPVDKVKIASAICTALESTARVPQALYTPARERSRTIRAESGCLLRLRERCARCAGGGVWCVRYSTGDRATAGKRQSRRQEGV